MEGLSQYFTTDGSGVYEGSNVIGKAVAGLSRHIVEMPHSQV